RTPSQGNLLRLTPKLSGRQERHTQNQPEGPPVRCYLSFFSRFPLISNSCFWPPKSDARFPLSLSRQTSAIRAFGLLPARLPLGRPRNESLVVRIEPQTGRFQYCHAQERFFFLAGEDQCAAGSTSKNLNDPETNRQILLRAIGEFIRATGRWLNAELAQHAGRKKGVGRYGIHHHTAFPSLGRARKRSNGNLSVDVPQI